ncbi:MAG: SelL-related redox protein [Saprospiraceae bacterium]|nr:SelL-related redox protein [Saprospiraceae bacterium]
MQNIQQIKATITNRNRNLEEASFEKPVLLVFLRHFGCIFCREAMKDIGSKRKEWEEKNINVVLVHMSDNETAEKYFKKYGIPNIEHISNPTCSLYASFGLTKGSASQLFGLKNWIRGFEVSVIKGTPIGLRQIGDGFQMPGVFLIAEGEVKDSYIHASASDRPNYESIISCCAA